MNDFLGHANGDRLLVTIADRVRTSIRVNDYCARLGATSLWSCSTRPTARWNTGERVPLARAGRGSRGPRRPTGLAHAASVSPSPTRSPTNPTPTFPPPRTARCTSRRPVAATRRCCSTRKMRADLDDARAWSSCCATPWSRENCACTISLRWTCAVVVCVGRGARALGSPTKGLMNAAEFITVAEETGLVLTIRTLGFRGSCRQLAEWRVAYPDLALIVRVNMSPRSSRQRISSSSSRTVSAPTTFRRATLY